MKIVKAKTVSPPKGSKPGKAKGVKPTKGKSNSKNIKAAITVKPTKRGAFVGGKVSKPKK